MATIIETIQNRRPEFEINILKPRPDEITFENGLMIQLNCFSQWFTLEEAHDFMNRMKYAVRILEQHKGNILPGADETLTGDFKPH